MFKMGFYILFFYAFISHNINASTLEEQIAFVDQHIESNIQNQMNQLYDYTHRCINQKGGVYAEVQEFIKTKDPAQFRDSRDFIIILGGIYALERLRAIENPTYITIDKMAETAATLFSPQLFVQNYKYLYANNFSIYKGSLSQIQKLVNFGFLALYDYKLLEKLNKKEGIDNEFYKEYAYQLPLKYLKPIIMTGENAIYHLETFLYALSKGYVLYGLTNTQHNAHNGLFRYPIEIYLHDQGHINELLSPKAGCTEDTYTYTVLCFTQIASFFYENICINKIFGASGENYNRAMLAAFYLLHENSVGFITMDNSHSLKSALEIIETKLTDTLEFYLKNLSTYHNYVSGYRFQNVSPKFNIILASHFASELVQLFPHLKKEIYGYGNDDEQLQFHAKKTLRYHLDNIKWFLKMIRSRL